MVGCAWSVPSLYQLCLHKVGKGWSRYSDLIFPPWELDLSCLESQLCVYRRPSLHRDMHVSVEESRRLLR